MRSKRYLIIILFLVIAMLAACAPTSNVGPDKTVELYLTAMVAKDEATLAGLSCADWEASALMELDSFQAVEVSISDLSCSIMGTEFQSTFVNCEGFLVATYNGENQKIDLSSREYIVQEADNRYLICGYK